MSFDYSAASRELQDRFDTRRLADRLAEVKVHHAFTPEDRAFIESVDMFFMATVDLAQQRRMRVEARARIDFEHPLLARHPEAQLVVVVEAERIYPNCGRYIHKHELVERSRFVPRSDRETPVPGWKRADWAADVLPAGDPARGAP